MQRHLARPPFVVRAAVTLIVALMAIGSVSAAEWRPSLSIGTNMVFSDNIVLRPAGQERGDVVVTVTPTISIAKTGARLKARGFYSPSFVTYLGGSANDTVRNTLDGTATLEAVENFFFVDGRAQINQTFLSPLGPAPVDAGSATNNRTEVATFGLSPYIRSRLPGGSSYQVRGDLNYTTTTTDSRPDILGTGVQASWNGAGGTFVTPGLEYNYSATQFGNQPAFGSQIARLKGVITFNPEFSVTTSGGYETNDFVFSRTEGVIYGGGFNWKPSPRTNVRANAEHRFFGTSYDYELLYRTRLTAWTLRGARRIQTSQQQMQQLGSSGARASLDLLLSESIPDPVERAQAIDQLLLQSGLGSFLGGPTPIFSPRILLIESVEPSLAIRGARSSLVLNLFWRSTEPLSAAVATGADAFASLDTINQRGGGMILTHKLSSNLTAEASIDRIYSSGKGGTSLAPTSFDSTQTIFRTGLTRQIAPRTAGSVSLRWQTFDSNGQNAYRERAVLLTLTHTFF